ncbi:MFS transporter [Alteromonas sp. NFXS44]|uniref:MFS transporter n=1 Tax=Alteromonas sp. NFXS44 TaxID=2818435 RepID=UPI0032DF355A
MNFVKDVAPQLSMKVKAGFSVGQIAKQLFRDAPSLLLLYYLANIMGIDPAIAGASIFVPKVFFGAVFDLLAGVASDKYALKFPRRHWLLVGAIAAPFAMIGPFLLPDMSETMQSIWIFTAFCIYMAVFSTFSVPFLAQFAEMTDSKEERTEMMAWKHAYVGVGLLAGSAGIPVLIHTLGGDRAAYLWSIALVGIICSVSLLIAWHFASSIPDKKNAAPPMPFKEMTKIFSDRNFIVLCAAAVVMTVAAGTGYASFVFFISYGLERAEPLVQIGMMTTVMGFAVMFASPFWVAVAKVLGKKGTFVCAAIAHSLVLFTWGTFTNLPPWTDFIFGFLIALFNSGWGLIFLSLLSDTIASSRENKGENRAGIYSAVWSIIEKAGIAAGGTLIIGLLLSLSGFDAAAAKQGLEQSQEAITGIIYSFTFIPGAAKVCSALIILFFFAQEKELPETGGEVENV